MAEPVKNCYGAPVPSSLQGCTEVPQQKNEVTIFGKKADKKVELVDVEFCKDVYFTEAGTLCSKAKTEFTYCSTFKVRADSDFGKKELARKAAEADKQAAAKELADKLAAKIADEAKKAATAPEKKEAKEEDEVDQKQKSLREQEKRSIPVSGGWRSIM